MILGFPQRAAMIKSPWTLVFGKFPLCCFGLGWIMHHSMVDFWGLFVLIMGTYFLSRVIPKWKVMGTYFLSRVIPKWKDIAKKHKGEDWRMDVKITFCHDENMIDFNNIKCALKDNDAIDNIMNIFFRHILKGVPKDPWIALTQLMNTLWVVDVKQWS